MSYAVYHAEKGAVSPGGIGNHIDREPGAEHTYEHANPELRNLNQNILVNEHCKKPLHTAISDRIGEGYNTKNKAGELKSIRKDAVKYTTHILTGSHEKMKEIEEDPNLRKKWIDANLDFIKNEYGEKNIVRFSIHRDEKTMHIHAVTVPLTEDGRLSAKQLLGNRLTMSKRQDRYAEQMQSFGLGRGKKATGIKHEGAREYYTRMKQAIEPDENLTVYYQPKGVIDRLFIKPTDIDLTKTLEKTQSALKTAKIQLSESKKNKAQLAILENKAKAALLNAQNAQNIAIQARMRAEEEKEKASKITLTAQNYRTMQEDLRETKVKYAEIEKKYDSVKDFEGIGVRREFVNETIEIYNRVESNIIKDIFKKVKNSEFDDFESLETEVKKQFLKIGFTNYYSTATELLKKEVEKSNYQFEEVKQSRGIGGRGM